LILLLTDMTKSFLTGCFIFLAASAFSQRDFLLFKKKNKTLRTFYEGSYIDFQTKNKEWIHGIITDIKKDSFYLTKEFVTFHLMGSDTSHISGFRYSLADIYGIPNKGIKIDYINGQFQINAGAGHVHFYWIKSGYVFRLGAIVYAATHIINNAIFNNFSLSPVSLSIAAGVYLFGRLLKPSYKPVLKLNKKYYIKSFSV
jgi:hypothetical protein